MFFIQNLRRHPAFEAADSSLNAEFNAYTAYCFASTSCINQCYAMMHVLPRNIATVMKRDLHAYPIRYKKLQALFCRGAICATLVSRLMRFQGDLQYGVSKALYHASCIISQQHFLVSKNAQENLFKKGKWLYDNHMYSDAARFLGQAALLCNGPAHAYLSTILLEGLGNIARKEQHAFQVACAGADLGCEHSNGVLARCIIYGCDLPIDHKRGVALAKASAATGSSFGILALGICYYTGCGVACDEAEAERLWRLAVAQDNATAARFVNHFFEKDKA